MADVGVLNLQIRDDSNEAAGGLDNLVSKLKSLSKFSSAKNDGLGSVAQHIRDIVEAASISDQKISASLKNVGTFLNSLSSLNKINSLKANVEPIKQLKSAIGKGFNIGQAGSQIRILRQALEGDWNIENARSARDSMKAIATGVEALEKSRAASTLGSVARALEKYNSALNAQKNLEESYKDVLGRYTGEPRMKGQLSIAENIQKFGVKKGSLGISEGQMKMDLDGLTAYAEGFTNIETVTHSAVEALSSVNEAISEVGSTAKTTQLNEFVVDPITQLMERFMNCEAASEAFRNVFDSTAYTTGLMSAESIIATKNIEVLTNRLNTPIKWKGLNEFVNQLTGVRRNFIDAKDAATAFANAPLSEVNTELRDAESIVRNIVANETDITNIAENCKEIAESVGGGAGQKLDFSVFDPSKLPLDTLGLKLDESSRDWYKYGEAVRDTFETVKNAGALDKVSGSVQEVGESVTAIIPYNENLENSWERICARIDEAKERSREASEIRARQEREFYAGTGTKDMEFTNRIAESLTQLDLLKARLREAQVEYNKLFNSDGPSSSKTIKKGLDVQSIQDKIYKYIESLQDAEREAKNAQLNPPMPVNVTNEMAQAVTELDLYKAKFADAQETYNELVNKFGEGDARTMQAALSLQNLGEKVDELEAKSARGQGALRELLASMEETIFGAEGLRGALKRMFPTLSGMLSRFKNIAKYRFLRTVLKQITSGAKEGLENVYRYSQIVGTGFAPAMDSAASALAQMKNSIGAALAPALQAIIPILNNIVSAFVNVINVANQFFALLTGQTSWTRALPQASQAFDDIKKSASGAGKATKDLLADWDELNIIQSENGGGGGSGKIIPDYENMFEQVSSFDEKIKGVVDTIKNGFGDVWGLVKEIGLALLAWKVSKAFSGFIGQLGSIIAGEIIMDIGLKFSYGGGFNAGSKGFFDETDFVQVVGGIIATGLGGSLITAGMGLGGGIGFGVGITVAIVASLVGYINGQEDMKDRAKWGNLKMTADEIKAFVKKQFSFNVTADIEILHANVTRLSNARREATQKISEFRNSLRNTELQLTLGMDASVSGENVSGALQDAQDAIKAVKGMITETEAAIEVGMKVIPFENSAGEDVSEDVLKSIKVADKTLYDYMTNLGNRLAQAMYDGEKNGWANGTAEAAIALMRSQEEIYNEAERLRQQRELDTAMNASFAGIDIKNGIIDRDTAMQAFEEQKKLLDEYKTAAIEEAKAEADSLNQLGDLAQAAANYELATGDKNGWYEGLQRAADDLYNAADLRMSAIEEQTERKLEETRATMKQMWSELFREVYGEDFENSLYSFLSAGAVTNPFDRAVFDWLGIDTDFAHRVGKLITQGKSTKDIADAIRKELKVDEGGSFLYNAFSTTLPEGSKEILDYFGIDSFDVYTSTAKQAIMEALIEAVGGETPGDADKRFAAEIFKSLFNVDSWDELDKYMPDGKVPEIPVSYGLKPTVTAVEHVDDEIDIWDILEDTEEAIQDANISNPVATVEVPAPVTFTTDNLASDLKAAYESNGLSDAEVKEIIGKYEIDIGDVIKFVGHSNLFDDETMRTEIIDQLEKSGALALDPNYVAKNAVRSGKIIGSAGMSDAGYGGYHANEAVSREENRSDIAGGVANGTAALATTLNAILQVAQAINRKPFTATINPTSAVARGVNASIGLLSNVTGDIP